MARSREEIKNEMIDSFMADETLQRSYGFDPNESFASQFSKVSIENIIFTIVSAAIWVLENLFDRHQEEVSNIISKRAHTLAWYRETALNFQYGGTLKDDFLEYDNSGLTDDQISKQKIVSKCSCTRAKNEYPTIIVKAVTENGKMTQLQKSEFESYMREMADAGVALEIVSENPDKLGLSMVVYYDPLLINSNGTLYNEEIENIVAKYIQQYLDTLKYNGLFYPKMLESYLMQCDGVKIANVSEVWVSISSGNTYNEPTDKSNLEMVSPESGAFVFDNTIKDSLIITYKQFTSDGNE